jgi:hypothetical protein
MDDTTLLPGGVTGFLSFATLPLPTEPERLAQVGVEIRRVDQTEFIPTGGDRKKLNKLFTQQAKKGDCTISLRGVGNDSDEFRGLCRQAVAQESGKWLEFKPTQQGVLTNFHWARVEHQGQTLYILLNWLYPFVAFARSLDWSNFGFIDHEAISRHLSHRYRVLAATELQRPIRMVAKKGEIALLEPPNALAEPGIRELWYWSNHGKTGVSVGQAIFNFWD